MVNLGPDVQAAYRTTTERLLGHFDDYASLSDACGPVTSYPPHGEFVKQADGTKRPLSIPLMGRGGDSFARIVQEEKQQPALVVTSYDPDRHSFTSRGLGVDTVAERYGRRVGGALDINDGDVLELRIPLDAKKVPEEVTLTQVSKGVGDKSTREQHKLEITADDVLLLEDAAKAMTIPS